MPMSNAFARRLYPILNETADHFGTPFHIYDETGIRETGAELIRAFETIPGFREYFAVKALPNLRILELIMGMGFGFDCSSIPELIMSRKVGARGDQIMFTSNNTTREEFEAALAHGGSIINLDDITLLDRLDPVPERICFRYNPGPRRTGNAIIGNPEEAKYGVSHDQILNAYRQAGNQGATRFGLHTMMASNTLDYGYLVDTAAMVLDLAREIGARLGIGFEFINIGGGLGIPYRPEDAAFELSAMASAICGLFEAFRRQNGYMPKLFMESGRYMTGPHGALITRAINRKDTYRTYIGVDACMSALMRPAIYGAYHHITIPGKIHSDRRLRVDVVGSLCENNDKFAVERDLPPVDIDDLLVIHDTGAHGHAMGFNYNGRLQPKELLLRSDGTVELIRREQTVADYLATQEFEPAVLKPAAN